MRDGSWFHVMEDHFSPTRFVHDMYIPGDNVFVTTDHMGEPMPLNAVVQSLQVTLTEYNVKIHEQSKACVYVKRCGLSSFAGIAYIAVSALFDPCMLEVWRCSIIFPRCFT